MPGHNAAIVVSASAVVMEQYSWVSVGGRLGSLACRLWQVGSSRLCGLEACWWVDAMGVTLPTSLECSSRCLLLNLAAG